MSIPIAFIINLREADSEDTIDPLNSMLDLDDIKRFIAIFGAYQQSTTKAENTIATIVFNFSHNRYVVGCSEGANR